MKPKFHADLRRTAEEISGLKVPYAPAKRKPLRWRWYLILAVVSAPLVYFGLSGAYSLAVISAPANLMLKQYELRSASTGYVKRMEVQVGDEVAQGSALVELSDPGLEEKRMRLSAELASLRRSSATGHNGSLAEILQEQLRLTEEVLRDRERSLRTLRGLFEAGAATLAEVSEGKGRVIQARADLNRAQADLVSELERQAPKTDVQFLNAQDRVKTELGLLEYQRGQLRHKSAYAGRVIDVYVSEGEFVAAGVPLLLIGAFEEPVIMAYLEPKYASSIHIGSTATVSFSGGADLKARVTRRPGLTKRLPAELVSTFGVRPMSVMLTLAPESRWPEGQLVHGLPLNVRFHYRWEHSLFQRGGSMR